MKKVNLCILISGRGSNMAALIAACAAPDFPAQVSVVASDTSTAKGLEVAQGAGVPTVCVPRKDFGKDRHAFETALLAALRPYPIDIVCLAGFMRILTPTFVEAWPRGRILNIHPSLLPAYKGLDTHARALADGASEHGCTVHTVIPELDSGPILVQRRVPVLPDDTVETLAARVLVQEHLAYVEAVQVVAKTLENIQ